MVNQYLYNKLSEITPKVYPDFIPMAVEYPAIMIELIELQNETYKGGSDLTNQTWAIHIVSPTVEERNLLSLEVIDKIEHKSDPAYYIDDCILIDSSTNYDKDVEMYINVMFFEIRVKDYEAYDQDAYDWDFEGTLTIGEFEGEGEVMEYGYRAGWGDDYGTLADFYTYYEYAGIYWTDGVLYVWGVNASVVQIGSVVLNEGTYNSSGYTTFECETNPFTGATAAIKVKGDATETWDYEGVLTVGGDGILNKGLYYDSSGNKNGNITGFISDLFHYIPGTKVFTIREGSIVKIDNNVIQGFIHYVLSLSSHYKKIILDSDPFPEVGETCTIKIKL